MRHTHTYLTCVDRCRHKDDFSPCRTLAHQHANQNEPNGMFDLVVKID